MEDFGNGQQSGIISGLDAQTVSAMKAAQRNFNDDFMYGASTSGFREYKTIEMATGFQVNSSLASTGENLSGILNGVNAANQLMDSVLTPKLTTYVTSYVTNVVMSYLSDAMVSMLSFDAGAIVSIAGSYMEKYIIKPGQIIQELLSPREMLNDLKIEDEKKKLIENINGKIGKVVGKVTDEINEQLETINPTIAAISYYSQMGPVWLQSKIDLATSKIVEKSTSKIGQARDNLNRQKQQVINSLAEGIAKKMADEVNDQIREKTKEANDTLNKTKQDALNKVKTMIINIKMKLFALIGA